MAGEAAGSSAGGEQPKFTAMVGEGVPYAVIVKYSEAVSSPVGRRWADLLIAEHLVLAVMVVAGQPAAQTDIIEAGDRVFLQARRFDRESLRERSGLISLGAIDDEFVGRLQHWLDTAEALAQQGRLSAGSVARVAWADDSISVSDALPGQAKVKTAKLHHTLKRRCLPCLN